MDVDLYRWFSLKMVKLNMEDPWIAIYQDVDEVEQVHRHHRMEEEEHQDPQERQQLASFYGGGADYKPEPGPSNYHREPPKDGRPYSTLCNVCPTYVYDDDDEDISLSTPKLRRRIIEIGMKNRLRMGNLTPFWKPIFPCMSIKRSQTRLMVNLFNRRWMCHYLRCLLLNFFLQRKGNRPLPRSVIVVVVVVVRKQVKKKTKKEKEKKEEVAQDAVIVNVNQPEAAMQQQQIPVVEQVTVAPSVTVQNESLPLQQQQPYPVPVSYYYPPWQPPFPISCWQPVAYYPPMPPYYTAAAELSSQAR